MKSWGKPLFGGQRAVSPRPPSEKAEKERIAVHGIHAKCDIAV